MLELSTKVNIDYIVMSVHVDFLGIICS